MKKNNDDNNYNNINNGNNNNGNSDSYHCDKYSLSLLVQIISRFVINTHLPAPLSLHHPLPLFSTANGADDEVEKENINSETIVESDGKSNLQVDKIYQKKEKEKKKEKEEEREKEKKKGKGTESGKEVEVEVEVEELRKDKDEDEDNERGRENRYESNISMTRANVDKEDNRESQYPSRDTREEKIKRLKLFRKYGGDMMFVTLIAGDSFCSFNSELLKCESDMNFSRWGSGPKEEIPNISRREENAGIRKEGKK